MDAYDIELSELFPQMKLDVVMIGCFLQQLWLVQLNKVESFEKRRCRDRLFFQQLSLISLNKVGSHVNLHKLPLFFLLFDWFFIKKH